MQPLTSLRNVVPSLRSLRGTAAEKGYVLALTALLILPLVGAVAISVDLGAWYARASQVQRVSDAAALAGVVYLPDTERAAQVAVATIQANDIPVVQTGPFTAATPDGRINVTITPLLGGTSQLKVDIVETSAEQYFSTVFLDDVSVGRGATAEFIKPVAMGSPKNFLGTGQLFSGADRENVWLAISGHCASREQGERIQARSDGNFTTPNNPPGGGNGWAGCQPGTNGYVEDNPEYRDEGYFYAFDVPAGYSGRLAMSIYDAPYCTSGSGAGDQSGAFTTRYTVRSNDSLDPRQATVLRTETLNATNSGSSSRCGNWWTIHDIPNATPGTYYLQVQSVAPTNVATSSQQGTNQFALRAIGNGGFSRCSSATSTATTSSPYNPNCLQVYGTEHMGVFANFSGTQPSFFLADLGPEHSGKILEITMWDMGEGTQELRILNPLLQRASFRWSVLCADASEPPCNPGEATPTGGWSGTTTNLNTSGTNHPQPRGHRLSSSRYNDRLMRIEIQLPDDIAAAYGGQTWWRVQYLVGETPSDRTTWSVIVRGDPVRLVP